ncbi:MFS transporter [Aureibacter tunicatorum]|uniref:Maltose/moltooligosaccharide transporter n=1 Tax=Aureibacter tunicatorum TaxID=866807 RepID=A0AAE3XJ50_9BACT|nr:MFS transporter [Aureibacter tunicatorum]MDR6238701.1 maltose/moltooligosaccharide transporter [Aureibacter tunicatorum]BDD05368.1 sugar transporter [Aureibacter tunicatorum]
MSDTVNKPKLSFWQMWNLSFGFLGVQFGFALQNANISRILSNFGADLHSLSIFWLVAPTVGLIVQPLVGASSDKTWNRMGRRSPFIFFGAIAATLGMMLLPNASLAVKIMPPLLFGALMFALMDTSFNVTFQPFRSLVADMLPDEQRNAGYSIQSFLINIGAVLGSALPYILTNWLGVANVAPDGEVADSVIWSFYIGGATLLLSVLWTVFKTKEYPPEQYNKYNKVEEESSEEEKMSFWQTLMSMPKVMFQLAIVQFFSWFALFLMWVYSTPAISQHIWNTAIGDSSSEAYNEAGNWVGILFAAYSVFAALFSLVMDKIANTIGRKRTYMYALIAGGLGYISIYFIQNEYALIISMAGVGIAWAAILAMPYAILSKELPSSKMGVYMGLFNITVVVPQIVSGLVAGLILKYVFHGEAIYSLMLAGAFMLLAGLSVNFVRESK